MRPNLRFPVVRTAETTMLGLASRRSFAVLNFTVLNRVPCAAVLLVSDEDRYLELPCMWNPSSVVCNVVLKIGRRVPTCARTV